MHKCMYVLVSQGRVFVSSPTCSDTHSVDQISLELQDLPASISGARIKVMCHYHHPAILFIYNPGWLGTHPVNQDGFEFRGLTLSISQVLSFKMNVTTSGQ